MWIPKEPDEILKIRNAKMNEYKNPKQPLLWAVGAFILSSLLIGTGYDKWKVSLNFMSLGLKYALIISFSCFVLLYFYQLLRKRPITSYQASFICNRCNEVKVDDNIYLCKCGGSYVNINEMRWVEDNQKKI